MPWGAPWPAPAALASPAVATAIPSAQVLDVATIRSQQQAVVEMDHEVPIGEAQFAVDQMTAAIGADQQALAGARSAAAEAVARLQDATSRLASDSTALAAAVSAVGADEARLAADRAALRSIAVGMYTGQLTDPQPASLAQLEAEQQKVIDTAEVETVTGVVAANLGRDLAAASADGRRQARLDGQVRVDRASVDGARRAQAASAGRASTAAAALGRDQGRLVSARAQLAGARAALASDLAALAGPPTAGGLSLIGGAALDPGQLADWFRNQGYVDLTPTPIGQLAAWYVQAGDQEGIRGDVAFAQAVLETGGFSSPDSVLLNNYAGIGHCDTCAAGWTFPSALGGVLGQTQLLRIFADGHPPATGPAPVLAALTPAHQGRRACCQTWESLTGVWASDPTYGAQILGLYQQMLAAALRSPAR